MKVITAKLVVQIQFSTSQDKYVEGKIQTKKPSYIYHMPMSP